ncbi:Hsp20/alpha crystallin family protein [Synechococcus sp. GFB01]|uniref:Hsp20/alpha crystallin family protein n=1 Tax=Synechococcus sp. GFB01 TaxID=1662190 RepID=UPI00064F2092|nr:Hsp20/alpha crystallin family protein [Synechococcus sp. GFB01]KMM17949.1 heat-shock protein [Synechococcus sp. GFB01]
MTLLSKWEPLREIEELFNRPWPWPAGRGSALQGLSDWTPRVDISEDASHYAIKADIPGVAKDDLKVSVDNGVVTIQGERRQEKEEENKRFHRVERFYGSFTRSFTLPDDADASGLKATARDGQLTVTIPKRTSEPSSTAVQVPVE